jgi:hypothetical protein
MFVCIVKAEEKEACEWRNVRKNYKKDLVSQINGSLNAS